MKLELIVGDNTLILEVRGPIDDKLKDLRSDGQLKLDLEDEFESPVLTHVAWFQIFTAFWYLSGKLNKLDIRDQSQIRHYYFEIRRYASQFASTFGLELEDILNEELLELMGLSKIHSQITAQSE